MKLMAEITADLLTRIVSLMSACGSDVIIHFSQDVLSFCVPGDSAQIQVRLWAAAESAVCFNKYVIESQAQNTIAFKTNLSQLSQVLVMDTPSILLRLAGKREKPFLQLTHMSLDSSKQVEHRIPILFLLPRTIEQYREPEWEQASMVAKFPALRALSQWCSNAKVISNLLLISINKSEVDDRQTVDVGFKVESDVVSVSTVFTDLAPGNVDIGDDDHCNVLVDLKKFIKILKVMTLSPTVALLYVYDKKMIRMHFEAPCGTSMSTLTYALNATHS